MEQLCLDCNSPVKGRTDKKFCNDQCRSNHNNRLKTEDQSFFKQVNQILKRNRAILKSKNPDGKIKIKRQTLLQKGFDFDYHTSILITQQCKTYYFCYEYGYLEINPNEVLLVKQLGR